MKITRSQLRRLIKEELRSVLVESKSPQEQIDFFNTPHGQRAWHAGSISEYEDMALGDNPDGIRKSHYSSGGSNPDGSWSNSDFNDVYRSLEKGNVPGINALDIDDRPIDDRPKPVDTDGDGTPDYRDTDSDNDGIPDSIEAVQGQDIEVEIEWQPSDSLKKYKDRKADLSIDEIGRIMDDEGFEWNDLFRDAYIIEQEPGGWEDQFSTGDAEAMLTGTGYYAQYLRPAEKKVLQFLNLSPYERERYIDYLDDGEWLYNLENR